MRRCGLCQELLSECVCPDDDELAEGVAQAWYGGVIGEDESGDDAA